jgi:hypothetical protein
MYPTELLTIKEHAQRLVAEHQTRARLEARCAELRAHHAELAEQLRIVGVVIGEMEAILNGPVITEGSDNAPPAP